MKTKWAVRLLDREGNILGHWETTSTNAETAIARALRDYRRIRCAGGAEMHKAEAKRIPMFERISDVFCCTSHTVLA